MTSEPQQQRCKHYDVCVFVAHQQECTRDTRGSPCDFDTRSNSATIAELVLEQLKTFAGQNNESVETDEGEIVQMVHYGELLAWIDEQGEKCKKCQP